VATLDIVVLPHPCTRPLQPEPGAAGAVSRQEEAAAVPLQAQNIRGKWPDFFLHWLGIIIALVSLFY